MGDELGEPSVREKWAAGVLERCSAHTGRVDRKGSGFTWYHEPSASLSPVILLEIHTSMCDMYAKKLCT